MAVTLTTRPAPPPLTLDSDGRWRVGSSRVSLVIVINEYLAGGSAEEIGQRYDTLELADVYGAIHYYLSHRTEVDAYLAELGAQSEAWRERCEERWPPKELFDRLRTRARPQASSD